MRLLYVIDSLAPGGAERSLAALAPHYRALGIELQVAYLRERDGVRRDLEAAGAEVVSLASPGGRLASTRRVRALARKGRPDLVHTTLFEADISARVGARLAGVPVVSSLVNVEYGPDHFANPALRPWKIRAAQAVDAATARLATRFHAVSAYVADTMADRLRIARPLIDVVPRGRDPERLGQRSPARRSAARKLLGVDEGAALIVAIARQDHGKGLDVLVRAAADVRRRVPHAQVVVAGRPGDQTARLRDLLTDTGAADFVQLVGACDDVADLLCAADAFALPSLREGMPGSLLEAMALGAPIVATDLPQIREVVDDDCARLVAPGSDVDLAQALVDVLAARDQAALSAERARTRFLDQFTIERVARQMLRFYERALAK